MKVETDTRAFHLALRDYQAAMRKDMAEVVRQQSKLFVRDTIELMKPASGPKGRKNVARDIARVFRDPKKAGAHALALSLIANPDEAQRFASGYDSKRIASRITALSASGNLGALSAVLARVGPKRTGSLPETPTASESLHVASKRRGSVPDTTRGYAFTGKRADLARYIKVVQERVGRAKGGWAECASALGVSLPQFVRRQSAGRGQCIIGTNPDNPSITLINRDAAAVAQDRQFNISARVYDKRVNSMDLITERIAKRHAEKASR